MHLINATWLTVKFVNPRWEKERPQSPGEKSRRGEGVEGRAFHINVS